MDKTCPCGKIFFVKTYLLKRKIYCSKKCFYKYRKRPSGLTYVLVKENPTSFKKGQKPWNTGLCEEKSLNWVGDKIGYDGVHDWVERQLGKPNKCEFCGTRKSKCFQWSNKDHKYRRVLSDYQRLCVKCHINYDYKKFGARKKFFEK